MKGDPLQTVVLAAKLIPNARPELVKELAGLEGIELPEGIQSLALISTDCDDVTYTAIDEATKKADCCVLYARSMYAGAANAHFISARDDDEICYYAHTISRTGSYLSAGAGIAEGEALAYLIAPPLESMYGMDAALKAADVKMVALYNPPSETNFGGGLLTGTQSACKSACDAFANAVQFVADNPTEY